MARGATGIVVAAAVVAAGMQLASGMNNGLAITPPMGWRSWNCFHGDVTDGMIRSIVDVITAKSRIVNGAMMSLKDLGYVHVGVDDGWQACGEGYNSSFHAYDGTPVVNNSKFPSLKGLVEYGHAKSVKMGWYDNNCICMDSYTLAKDPEWAERSFAGDVQLLLDAGFDSIKIDNCGDDQAVGFSSRIKHINESGKAILIENSNQGFGNPQRGPCHGNMQCPGPNCRGNPNNTLAPGWCPYNFFRTGGDNGPTFEGVMNHLQATLPYLDHSNPISQPGCWAYPDMLEVGNFNEANNTLGFIESRTHFGAWVVVSAPLILGLDLTDKANVDAVWPIISNTEAIEINQVWAGHPGRLVLESGPEFPGPSNSKAVQVWAKTMPSGGQAVFIVNRGTSPASLVLDLVSLGITSKVQRARDIWAQRDVNIVGKWTVDNLGSHDSLFVRFYV